MNLLPKSHEEFSKADYWNTFFKKRGKKAFEWYGEFPELSSYLLKYLKPKDDVLIVGCGNSTLGMDLYDSNYKNIVNIDVSEVVIKQMQEINKVKRPDLIFEQMDATKMSYEDGKFSVILDKGTLDALMPDNNEDTLNLISKYLDEIKRVLRNSGRYICISLLQEHIIKTLVEAFSSSFPFRVTHCHDAEIKAREKGESPMPVFMVVATKFVKLQQPILELVLADGSIIRVSNGEEIASNVKSVQISATLCNSLFKGSIGSDDEIFIDLFKSGDKNPRYTIYILDQLTVKDIKTYAAFIVPQGREVDWLFSTKEGRQQLLKSAQHDRLAIVILRRGQTFQSLEAVKIELADSIKNFAPAGLSKSQIPFLSLGPCIGTRKIRYEGKSEISGPIVVEEIEMETGIFRRLVFLNNQFVIQSEAKLKQVTSRRKKTKLVVDPNFVACNHHLYMSVGLKTALTNSNNLEAVIIGLGGGGLCTFIQHYIKEAKITAVEIDKVIVKVATEYFDLVQDEKLDVIISDGIDYLKKASAERKRFGAILFDVDGKDISVGMSCPPQQFVEPDFLKVVENCLSDEGFFILNLVARNEQLHDAVISDLKNIYQFVSTYKVAEEINEIVYCCKAKKNFNSWKNSMQESAKELNDRATAKKNSSAYELFDIVSLLKNLKIES